MLALAFLNPLLLWGVPLAAVPIVIHLLNRRRFQKLPWAAMEFLLAAMKRNRKRLRMEQWLVLLLRTLAVLFLVFLVSRPQLGGGGLIGTRTHHVFVLDDSASMSQRSGSTTLFTKAQDRLRAEADRLGDTRGGDLYSLVRTGKPAQPDLWAVRVGPELGTRVGALVKELTVGDGGMDLGEVLAEVRKKAADVKEAGASRFYLVTDQRAADWVHEDDKPRPALLAQLAAMEPGQLSVLEVGGQHPNLAVVDVRRTDRLAVAGVPVTIAVDVQNFGLDSSPPTEVAIEVDGQGRVVRPVGQLAPGERTSIPVTHTFHQAGFHRVEALLPVTEHYPLDDRRTLAIEVQERSKVLLVDGEPDIDNGETFFLQVALDPGGEAVSGIEAETISDAMLVEHDLGPYDMVWLCNVTAPSEAVAQKLEQYAAAGGGIVIWCGALVDSNRYNELFWRDGKGLLPLPLGEIAGDPDRPEHAFLARKDHPVIGNLGDVVELLMARVVLVKRYLTISEDPKAGAAVIARIHDAEGPPLLVSRTFGSGGGEVLLFAISADKHWSNLPDTYLNVVLANQAHRAGARRADQRDFNLGTRGTYRLSLDPGVYKADVNIKALAGDGEDLTVTAVEPKPEPPADGAAPGAPPPAAGAGPAKLQLELAMADLRTLGAYQVELQPHGAAVQLRLFARNPPVEESRLVGMTAAAFQRSYPAELHNRVLFLADNAGLGSGTGEGELWRLLAAALLLGMLTESLLAWRFGRR